MATTATELRRELLTGIRDTTNEIDDLLAQTIKDIDRAARRYRNNQRQFEKAVLAAIATFWASYRLLTRRSNKAVAQSFVTYVDSTVGTRLLKVGATQNYMDLVTMPPTGKRPKGDLQLKLEAAHNAGNKAEEARLNKLVDASMRTDAGMSASVREEFLKAMRAGKPITMTEAQRRAGVAASSAYSNAVERSVLTRISPYDGRNIEQRIVTLNRAHTQMVEKLIAQGIDDGLSVNQLARSIQNYIDPRSQAGRRFTAGNGINYRAVPIDKRLPKNNIRYNAVRIARTEIMTTYDIAASRYYQDQPWTSGWDWILSNTHAGQDDCDTLAEQSPHETLPDRPHPQCACNARPRVATLSEFEQLVRDGKIR